MNVFKAYTYDDLMLVPQHSTIKSRKEPDISTFLSKKTLIKVPIISAPMNTVTESEMAKAMIMDVGAQAVIHRYMNIENQVKQLLDSGKSFSPFMAIGATGDFLERAEELYQNGALRFCVDVANGHSQTCLDAVSFLRKKFGDDIDIMAGNVCSFPGTENLVRVGANIIRVGIGPGAMCTTRLVTGFGVPQLTAIDQCAQIKKIDTPRSISIIADGGVRNSGDLVKAIAMGADAIMIGGMLAGAEESPGKKIKDPILAKYYKMYNGMASKEGREEWFSKSATSFVPEGSSTKVWCKGSVKEIVENLTNSLKVGMSFANARNLDELRANAQWVEVSENGKKEGTTNKRMFK